jgi:arginyl-tRNA synthetase
VSAAEITSRTLEPSERELIKVLGRYQFALAEAARKSDPSEIANYLYEVTKTFNRFYDQVKIVNEADPQATAFRLHLSTATGAILEKGLDLLGIRVPERM